MLNDTPAVTSFFTLMFSKLIILLLRIQFIILGVLEYDVSTSIQNHWASVAYN